MVDDNDGRFHTDAMNTETLYLMDRGASRASLPTLGSAPTMPASFFSAPNGKELFPPRIATMSSGLRSEVGMGGPNEWYSTEVPVEPQYGAINNLAIQVNMNGRYLSYRDSVNVYAQIEQAGMMNARAPLAPDQCG